MKWYWAESVQQARSLGGLALVCVVWRETRISLGETEGGHGTGHAEALTCL